MSDWRERAACRDVDEPEIFTVAAKDDALGQYANLRAKRICAGCTVRVACRAYGEATGAVGLIHGGEEIQAARRRNGTVPASHEPRDCPECKQRFKPFNPQQKYCGNRCTTAADRKRTNEKRRREREAAGRPDRVFVDRQHAAIADLAGTGKTDVAIALKLGCSPKSVERVRNQRGIPAGTTQAAEVAA